MSVDFSNWRFRGEGNASLVLVNSEEKRVYRFPKYTHWGKGHLIASEKSKAERVHEELQLVVDYMSNVMQPLLSTSFVVLPELSLIPAGLTEQAETQIQVSRPAQRKGKDVEAITIDSSTISALVFPDLCYVRNNQLKSSAPTISVEIKPKKAFMHTRRDSLSDISDERSQVCKFCMHQRLKAKEGQWPNTSQYCPLDLFSGDRKRMKQALLALAETPQNNLRICQNGEEIHGAWNKENLCEIFEKFFGNWPNGLTNGLWRQQALHTLLDLVLEALLFVPEDNKENEQPVTFSTSNHVQCSHSNEQSLKTSHSVQYCQNSCVTDSKQRLSDPGHNRTSLDCKQLSSDSGHSRTLSDNKQPVIDLCHYGSNKPVLIESSLHPVQCSYTSKLSTNPDKFSGGFSRQLKQTTLPVVVFVTSSGTKRLHAENMNHNSDCELPHGCVLERVLSVQRLDNLDIHGIFPLYQHIDKYLRDNPSQRGQYCLDGPYTMSGWLCLCAGEQKNCQCITGEDVYMQESVQKVKKFLVSKTVQDCSIMVALQPLTDGDSVSAPCITDPCGGRYRFSVSIIDLDPKPFCKIPTYHMQDKEIVSAYKEACKSLKNQEDQLQSVST